MSQQQSEERFQNKLSPTSNATATSSEIRNEDQRENLSPRTSLVISTRAVTTPEEKKPDGSGSKRDCEYCRPQKLSWRVAEERKKAVVLGGVFVSVVFKEEHYFSTSIC